MKHLLVQEDQDGVEQLWGRCAGVETFRGCSSGGLLSDVLAEPDVALRGLGGVCVEVWDPPSSTSAPLTLS